MKKNLVFLGVLMFGFLIMPSVSHAWGCNLSPVTRYSSSNNSSGLNDSQTGVFGYDVIYDGNTNAYYYRFIFNNFQYTGVDLTIHAPKTARNGTCDLQTVTGKTPQQIYNWEYGVDAVTAYSQSGDSGSYTYEPVGCGNTHYYSKKYNGVCGSSNGGTYSTAPSTNLCSAGTATTVTTGSTTYTWLCNGVNGGTNASCSANISAINGDCGTTVDSCVAGTLLNTPSDTPSQYRWSCAGQNGGTTESCSINKEDANPGDNNGQGNFDPYCVVNPRVSPIGEPITWSIVTGLNNEAPVSFDWVSNAFAWASSQTDQSFLYESDEALSIGSSDISANVTHAGDPRNVTCASARFIEDMIVAIEKPIIEEGDQCILNWSKVDIDGTCVLKNQQSGSSMGSITAASGSMPVDALQPGDKYFIECSFFDLDTGQTDIVVSEYVSCVKKGKLQEI